jgi:hypothetical protein
MAYDLAIQTDCYHFYHLLVEVLPASYIYVMLIVRAPSLYFIYLLHISLSLTRRRARCKILIYVQAAESIPLHQQG